MPLLEGLANFIKRLFSENKTKTVLYEFEEVKEPEYFVSVWDYLIFKENTQAHHLSKVIGFEEWVSMKEILRRITEIFHAEYKNEKSLYPYLKTLTDIGLFETSDVGGLRKWRKKEILIKITQQRVENEKDLISSRVVA